MWRTRALRVCTSAQLFDEDASAGSDRDDAQIHYEAFRSKQLLALKESSSKQAQASQQAH